MSKRLKNPYFYLGLIGVVFGSAGIEPETLTSWSLLFDAFKNILSNPVAIVSVIAALVGVFVDPSTSGLKDKNLKIQEEL